MTLRPRGAAVTPGASRAAVTPGRPGGSVALRRPVALRLSRALVGLAGLATLVWSAAWALTPDWTVHLRALQVSHFALSALIVASALLGTSPGRSGRERLWFWGVAIAARAALVPHTPPLSHDLYRYLWDAQVWRHGINPFRYAPLDAHLRALRDPSIYPRIHYPEIPTIYPLVAQAAFLLASWIAPGVAGWKAVLCVAELAGVALLRSELGRRGLPKRWAVLAAWHPLALTEVAANGHVDALGAVLLLASMAWLARRRATRSPVPASVGRAESRSTVALSGAARSMVAFAGAARSMVALARIARSMVALAGAALVKWNALVVLPALRLRKREMGLALGLTLAGALAFAATPGVQPFVGLGQYLGRWRWNDALFWPLHALLAALPAARGMYEDRLLLWCKLVALALLLAWVLAVSRRERDPALAARSAFGTLLLLAPTIHPWYALWLLPLVALAPEAGWLWLFAALPLAYGPGPAALATRQEELTLPLRLLEFGPAFAWWLMAATRARAPRISP